MNTSGNFPEVSDLGLFKDFTLPKVSELKSFKLQIGAYRSAA